MMDSRRLALMALTLVLGVAAAPAFAAKQPRATVHAASAGDWTYIRDPDGNITKTIAPNGRVSTTTFDAFNRPGVTTYEGAGPGEVSKVTRHYDGNGNVTAIEEVIDGVTRTETRTYDHFDRLEHVTDVHGRTLDYTYDAVGNRTRMRDGDGETTVWTYDALNCNTGITVPGQGTTTQTCYPSGKLDTITHPDGSTSTTTYDNAGRIETLIHAKAGQTLASYRYRYDLNGNRIEQKETNGAGEQITEYRYDDADRLTRIIEPDRTTVYTLDPVGNRVEELVTDATGTVISHSILTYNKRDQLIARDDPATSTHVDQTYDANGNLKSQQVGGVLRTYSYDGQDRLVELVLPNQPPIRFDYDPRGQRIEKSQGSLATRYQYDDRSLTAETNTIGNTLKRYHYSAQQLLGETLAGSTPVNRQFLLDALKTPIAVLTQTGAISARTRYDAWGRIVSQTNEAGSTVTPNRDAPIAALPSTDSQPFGFTGYVKDGESGLYYANARYYDPATARFTTEDPEAGKDLTPPSLHRYLYAYANPTVYTDPDGRWPLAADLMGRKDFRRDHEEAGFGMASAELANRDSQQLAGLRLGAAGTTGGVAAAAALSAWGVPQLFETGQALWFAGRTVVTQIVRHGVKGAALSNPVGTRVLLGVGAETVACSIGNVAMCPSTLPAGTPNSLANTEAQVATAEARAANTLPAFSEFPAPPTKSAQLVREAPSGRVAAASTAGSGGGIRYVATEPSTAMVGQELPMSCGPACARQLLLDRGTSVDESVIRSLARLSPETGTSAEGVADALNALDRNSSYVAGSVMPEHFEALNGKGPWIAQLKPGAGSHFVIVDGAKDGNVLLRDPWGANAPGPGQGLQGTVKTSDFMEYWRRALNKMVYREGDK